MDVGRLGSYIREQRESARLSLRKLAGSAGVSIPYLSQVERGLRKPSAEILQSIAKGLQISAETLYVQAGILEARPSPGVEAAIMADVALTHHQRQALLATYRAFRDERAGERPGGEGRGAARSAADGERQPRRSTPRPGTTPITVRPTKGKE